MGCLVWKGGKLWIMYGRLDEGLVGGGLLLESSDSSTARMAACNSLAMMSV